MSLAGKCPLQRRFIKEHISQIFFNVHAMRSFRKTAVDDR
jgi:hypothetical protein